MNNVAVAIVGAGPYGLSLAAHFGARKIEHRIFGQPMQFWSQVANAGAERYLRTYCFGTNISTPKRGFSFADHSAPLGLETFEPCSIGQFADYGLWFQKANVPWVEPVDVMGVTARDKGFKLTLANGESVLAGHVIIATGLAGFAQMPPAIAALPKQLGVHTSQIESFGVFRGRDVAVIGAGQSALEAAALLNEAGARPQLIIREPAIHWMKNVSRDRSLAQRLRSPISALGSGPTAWALAQFPGVVHRFPEAWRSGFLERHLPPSGAWWLRDRVENRMPVHLNSAVTDAREVNGRVALSLRNANRSGEHRLVVDHVVAGTGYAIDVDRIGFLDPALRAAIDRLGRGPELNAYFETSVSGLMIVGPSSAISFGPLFRFVGGCEYTAKVVATRLALAHGRSMADAHS